MCPTGPLPNPRYASLRTLFNPGSSTPKDVLDSGALVLYFPAPKTVTGEEVLELHIHGGPATVKAVLGAIPQCSSTSIRYAEPGEFTRRAFQNNRLDLAQVEALSDTLSAETEQQRRAAVRGNSGTLGRTYETWRQQLLYVRGELEAIIDFSEDQDFDVSNMELLKNIEVQIRSMVASIESHKEASRRGELLRKGIRISMLGPPNVGKSSLLNQIVGREASIVSTEAGTTRDIVEVSLDIDGYLCIFADTAGLRSWAGDNQRQFANVHIGKVEEEGIRRAKAKAAESDIIILLASVEPSVAGQEWEIRYDIEALQIASQSQKLFIVVNKADVISEDALKVLIDNFKTTLPPRITGSTPDCSITPISCRHARRRSSESQDPGNVKRLVSSLVESFKEMTIFEDEALLGVTERQRQLLENCREHCHNYLSETQNLGCTGDGEAFDIVLAAEHLRSAANCLSRITGRGEAGDVEEVLGVVFEK
jgi:tRNA modification GTPase